MPVAPRIVNDVSYVTTINDAHHFSWQGQYLVMSECHMGAAFGDVFLPSLSLWTAWRACYSEFPSCSYCVSVF